MIEDRVEVSSFTVDGSSEEVGFLATSVLGLSAVEVLESSEVDDETLSDIASMADFILDAAYIVEWSDSIG